MSEEITVPAQPAGEMTLMPVEQLVKRVEYVHEVAKRVLKDGVHVGTIPGVDKPFLLKPGAEVLCTAFGLRAHMYSEIRELGEGHREYEARCVLKTVDGIFAGEGYGLCTTMETKYRYRAAKRKCPECGQETIIKGKEKYGGGFVCWVKQGGCGAKFAPDDKRIAQQETGKVENPDIADCYNTCLKMAEKRAHVDAVLRTTGASEQFTQDEETVTGTPEKAPEGPKPSNPGVDAAATAYVEATIDNLDTGPPEPSFKPEDAVTKDMRDRIAGLIKTKAVTDTQVQWWDNVKGHTHRYDKNWAENVIKDLEALPEKEG